MVKHENYRQRPEYTGDYLTPHQAEKIGQASLDIGGVRVKLVHPQAEELLEEVESIIEAEDGNSERQSQRP